MKRRKAGRKKKRKPAKSNSNSFNCRALRAVLHANLVCRFSLKVLSNFVDIYHRNENLLFSV
jgi:hypothetical protein